MMFSCHSNEKKYLHKVYMSFHTYIFCFEVMTNQFGHILLFVSKTTCIHVCTYIDASCVIVNMKHSEGRLYLLRLLLILCPLPFITLN